MPPKNKENVQPSSSSSPVQLPPAATCIPTTIADMIRSSNLKEAQIQELVAYIEQRNQIISAMAQRLHDAGISANESETAEPKKKATRGKRSGRKTKEQTQKHMDARAKKANSQGPTSSKAGEPMSQEPEPDEEQDESSNDEAEV